MVRADEEVSRWRRLPAHLQRSPDNRLREEELWTVARCFKFLIEIEKYEIDQCRWDSSRYYPGTFETLHFCFYSIRQTMIRCRRSCLILFYLVGCFRLFLNSIKCRNNPVRPWTKPSLLCSQESRERKEAETTLLLSILPNTQRTRGTLQTSALILL